METDAARSTDGNQRVRSGRRLVAVAATPRCVGIGIGDVEVNDVVARLDRQIRKVNARQTVERQMNGRRVLGFRKGFRLTQTDRVRLFEKLARRLAKVVDHSLDGLTFHWVEDGIQINCSFVTTYFNVLQLACC